MKDSIKIMTDYIDELSRRIDAAKTASDLVNLSNEAFQAQQAVEKINKIAPEFLDDLTYDLAVKLKQLADYADDCVNELIREYGYNRNGEVNGQYL